MLNRRYLRIKVMQALYAYFQSTERDIAKSERELLKGIHSVYDLYIYQLAFLVELQFVAAGVIEDAKKKRLPTEDELNPNLKFVNNLFLNKLTDNIHLKREMHNRKINWNNEYELVRKVYKAIKTTDMYEKYMNAAPSYESDRTFIIEVFKHQLSDHEVLNHMYEEKNLHWGDDIYLVNPMIVKTIKSFNENEENDFPLMPLYKDIEDEAFVKTLFVEAINQEPETKKMIAEKTKNWDVDRIAMMDVLLMKMALTEVTTFSNIPVKVTLNEFIEISKTYSTPKSNNFINGILDKLITDLKSQKKITKTGRGLMN